jgi:hypothetical protein
MLPEQAIWSYFHPMTTRQKFGLALIAGSLAAAVVLQVVFASLYTPESIHDIQIVPPPPDLTPVLFFLSINWPIAFPLLAAFICGVLCLFMPNRQDADSPQWIDIKYVH